MTTSFAIHTETTSSEWHVEELQQLRINATRRVSEAPQPQSGLADLCRERQLRVENNRRQMEREAILRAPVQYPLEFLAKKQTRPCVEMHNRAQALLDRIAR